MRFENSKFFKEFKNKKIVFPFGIFYLCKNFIISEINEGEHFDIDKLSLVILKLIDYYGKDAKLGFISNRVNSYSLNPQLWYNCEKKHDLIIASSIVVYNKMTYMNATIEKQFSKKSIKRCESLEESINWILNLKEFQNSKTLPSLHSSTLLKKH